jgi:hypothetical protein
MAGFSGIETLEGVEQKNELMNCFLFSSSDRTLNNDDLGCFQKPK